MNLALTYSSNATALGTLATELSQNHAIRISKHQVDVASPEQIESMFREIDREHGQRPDILISNAGYGKRVPNVWDISLEEFDYTITVNLRASFVLVKGVVEHMKSQRWGRIVFMSSIAAHGGGINGCRMFLLSPFFTLYTFQPAIPLQSALLPNPLNPRSLSLLTRYLWIQTTPRRKAA